jgi:Na+-driven multidrug efflux pump
VTVTGLVLGLLEVILGKQLLGIYTSSPEVIEAGIRRLTYIASIYFTCGVMDVMVGALRGVGYSVMPMIVSLVGVCGVRLVWIATVFGIEQYHRVETVYISYPISWITTFLVHVVTYFAVRKRVLARMVGRSAATEAAGETN